MKIFIESALCRVCAIGKARRVLQKLKIPHHAVLIGLVACILASNSCSSTDGTAATPEETVSFVAGTDHKKPKNPRVHPGQPYTQLIGLDL